MILEIVLASFALWTITALVVAMSLTTVRKNAWHRRFISFAFLTWSRWDLPRGNCAYFWWLFFAPVVIVLRQFAAICHLMYDWIIAPVFLGKLVSLSKSSSYWKQLFYFDRYSWLVEYSDFSLRRFSVPLVIVAAIVAWLYLGMITLIPCSDGCTRSTPREFAQFAWLFISGVGGFMVTVCSIAYLFEKHDVHPIDGLVDFVSGKVCKQVSYEEQSSGQAD